MLAVVLRWQPDWNILDPIYTIILSLVIIGSTFELAGECTAVTPDYFGFANAVSAQACR